MTTLTVAGRKAIIFKSMDQSGRVYICADTKFTGTYIPVLNKRTGEWEQLGDDLLTDDHYWPTEAAALDFIKAQAEQKPHVPSAADIADIYVDDGSLDTPEVAAQLAAMKSPSERVLQAIEERPRAKSVQPPSTPSPAQPRLDDIEAALAEDILDLLRLNIPAERWAEQLVARGWTRAATYEPVSSQSAVGGDGEGE